MQSPSSTQTRNLQEAGRAFVCLSTAPMIEVMQAVNANPDGVAFIVDAQGKWLGRIDKEGIQRRLLAGLNLADPVGGSGLGAGPSFIEGSDYAAQFERLKADSPQACPAVPILNAAGEWVGLYRSAAPVQVPVASAQINTPRELSYLMDAYLSGWISSTGRYIEGFEGRFAEFCGVEHALAVSNGTVALHLAMVALGIGEGDEVIVPDLTFAATINTVLHAKATPVIVDVDLESWTMDPAEFEKAITPRTKAVIPVHLYGQPCDMDRILEIARRRKLFVIEDAAQAHGATYHSRKVGSLGDIGCFSFFGNKIVTTGEGGICTTNSSELRNRMKVLRDHGMSPARKYFHEVVGYNYRMTNLQAAIGFGQMERIHEILQLRSEIEARYQAALAEFPFIRLQRGNFPGRSKVNWLVSALIDETVTSTTDLIAALRARGIDCRHFFIPLSQMPIYAPYVFSCRNSAALSRVGMNFPTFNAITDQQIEWIRTALRGHVAR